MRVIFAPLPAKVRLVLLDPNTVVVSDEMRMMALPYLPACLAAVLAATGVAQKVAG